MAIAEQNLLPALKDADAGTIALADGFGRRTQLEHLADRRGWHLAELLAAPSIGQLGG